MKKIGIITYSGNNNAGSFLQCYATQRLLSDLGYEGILIKKSDSIPVKIINRLKRKIVYYFKIAVYRNSAEKIIKRKRAISVGDDARVSQIYRQCFKENINCEYLSGIKLRKKAYSDEFAAFLSGSDQIWNPGSPSLEPIYFLRFAPQNKRIAFAPSLGVTEIPDYSVRNMKKYISEYSSVSIRETSGAIVLKKLLGRDIPVISDPVISVSAQSWKEIYQRLSSCDTDKKMTLLYFLDKPSAAAVEAIEFFKQNTDTDVIAFQNSYDVFDNVHIKTQLGTPFDFVKLVDNAAFVLTDSFHATAFSVKLKTPFWTFRREYQHDYDQSTRIESFLKNMCLIDRFVVTMSNLDSMRDSLLLPPDFTYSTSVLEREAASAVKYLQSAIAKAEGSV